jgi:hypothetical protein
MKHEPRIFPLVLYRSRRLCGLNSCNGETACKCTPLSICAVTIRARLRLGTIPRSRAPAEASKPRFEKEEGNPEDAPNVTRQRHYVPSLSILCPHMYFRELAGESSGGVLRRRVYCSGERDRKDTKAPLSGQKFQKVYLLE